MSPEAESEQDMMAGGAGGRFSLRKGGVRGVRGGGGAGADRVGPAGGGQGGNRFPSLAFDDKMED